MTVRALLAFNLSALLAITPPQPVPIWVIVYSSGAPSQTNCILAP